MFRVLLPHERRGSVYQLDLEALWARGVRGIIFDFDNTLGPWGFERLDGQALRWLKTIQEHGFRVGFLSNHEGDRRKELLDSLDGHPVVFDAGKPRPSGYRSLLSKLGLPPHQVVMVGDQIFTDIWGAKRLGIYTVLVRPVSPEREGLIVRLRRLLERLILRWG